VALHEGITVELAGTVPQEFAYRTAIQFSIKTGGAPMPPAGPRWQAQASCWVPMDSNVLQAMPDGVLFAD